MKNSNFKVTLACCIVALAFFWGCGGSGQPKTGATNEPQGRLPKDVLAKCTVGADTFKTWFADSTPTENGKITNANSVTFPSVNNCSFYQWSEQMFLWLVSPDKGGKYTPGNTVLESPLFYDVTAADAAGNQVMIRHVPGTSINVAGIIKEVGPDGLLLVTDDKGNDFEVEAPKPKAPAMVMGAIANGAERSLAVAHIAPGSDALHHIFKDQSGKIIEHPKAQVRNIRHQEPILEEIKADGQEVFIDTAGNEHTILIGQATNHVLIAAQNNSLVYYAIMVNDVYAYYLTAFKKNRPFTRDSVFPTTAAARDSICAYAREMGAGALPDSDALAMELKLSLVETTGLKNPETYITINANVPIYDTTNKNNWVPTGKTRPTKLAIIGIHVVGSVSTHPEMAWATFEHKNNAPNGSYDYLTSKGDTVHVTADTGSGWLLCSSSSDQPYNKPHMKVNGDSIVSLPGFTISASSTNLVFPFGSMIGDITNPENRSSAASNSEVIGINNSVIGQLVGNDLRKNYILIGATWTSHGANPSGASFSVKDSTPGVAIGTNMLANSTMETYFQKPGRSCFFCHNGPTLSPENENGLSHIFSYILPLKPEPPILKK